MGYRYYKLDIEQMHADKEKYKLTAEDISLLHDVLLTQGGLINVVNRVERIYCMRNRPVVSEHHSHFSDTWFKAFTYERRAISCHSYSCL